MKKLIFLFSLLALLLATTAPMPCFAGQPPTQKSSTVQPAPAAAPVTLTDAPASTPEDAQAEEGDAGAGERPAETTATEPSDWKSLLSYYKKVIGTAEDFNLLLLLAFSLISYLFAYFSAKVPFLKKINSTWERVIVAGIVVGIGFSGFVYQFDLNLMTILEQVIGFVFATKFIHPIVEGQGLKTPKPKTA